MSNKDEILELVGEYYRDNLEAKEFIPGKTRVHYSGRVFGPEEVKALVSSSLDFWLTLGPKGQEFEDVFSSYLGIKHIVPVNSGSSANLLAVSSICSRLCGASKRAIGKRLYKAQGL